MRLSTQQRLHKRVDELYKVLASTIYKEFSEEDGDEVRVEILRSITNHSLSRIVERLQRKIRKHKKIKKENIESLFIEIEVDDKDIK